MRIILKQINLATYLVEFQHVKIMKKIKTIFLTFFLALVNVSHVFADPPGTPGNLPPTHPNLPIDQGLVYLSIAGLILGASVIYRNKIKKASM